MRHRHLAYLLVACLLPWLGACTMPNSRGHAAIPDARAQRISQDIHRAVNRYRSSHRLPPLARLDGMDTIALQHSRYLLGNRGTFILHGHNVSHRHSDQRASACKRQFGMTLYGENVAAITSSPNEPIHHIMTLWKTSFHHDQAMRGPWTHTGISTLIDNDGALFITQIFAKQ